MERNVLGSHLFFLRTTLAWLSAVCLFSSTTALASKKGTIEITMPEVGYGDRLGSHHFGWVDSSLPSSWEREASGWYAFVVRDLAQLGGGLTRIDLVRSTQSWSDSKLQKQVGHLPRTPLSVDNRMPPVFLSTNRFPEGFQARWIRDEKWSAQGVTPELDTALLIYDGKIQVVKFGVEAENFSFGRTDGISIQSDLIRGGKVGPVFFDSELGLIVLPIFGAHNELIAVESAISVAPNKDDSPEQAKKRVRAQGLIREVVLQSRNKLATMKSIASSEGKTVNVSGVRFWLNDLAEELDQVLDQDLKELLRRESISARSELANLLSKVQLVPGSGGRCHTAFKK